MDLTQACLALVHSSSVFNELLCVMQWAGSVSAHTRNSEQSPVLPYWLS